VVVQTSREIRALLGIQMSTHAYSSQLQAVTGNMFLLTCHPRKYLSSSSATQHNLFTCICDEKIALFGFYEG
jgi:hypothetical protein